MSTQSEQDRLEKLRLEIVTGLRVPETDPCWVAVNLAINHLFEDVELPAALAPSQTPENRALNNGRAAMLQDFKNFLLERWNEAHSAPKKVSQ